MGATKKYFYSKNQLKLANLYKALGHPARISLVQQILEQRNSNCTTLENSLQLSKSSVSQHPRVLHDAGITGYEVVGSNCIYHVNPTALEYLTDSILDFGEHTQNLDPFVYCKDL